MKFILIMKICSALSGNCLPEHNGGVHDTWYDCAVAGTLNTLNAMAELGREDVNKRPLPFQAAQDHHQLCNLQE